MVSISGTVVTDAARQHVVDVGLDEVVHDAALQHARRDGRSEPTRSIHRALIARMWLRCPSSTATPASRSTPSDVPYRARSTSCTASAFPGQQHVDVAASDQVAEVPGAATVHDDRPGDEGDPAALRLHMPHHGDDLGGAHFDPTLGGHVVGHEREPEPVPLPELGRHTDPVQAAHHRIALLDVPQLAAAGGSLSDDDHRVHAWMADGDPRSLVTDVRLMIRRRVEVVGDHPVRLGRHQRHVPLRHRMTPERHQVLEEQPEAGRVGRGHPQREVRILLVGPAQLELEHLELAAALDDLVEDRVQQLRVDEVAFGLDDLGGFRDLAHPAIRPDEPRVGSRRTPRSP